MPLSGKHVTMVFSQLGYMKVYNINVLKAPNDLEIVVLGKIQTRMLPPQMINYFAQQKQSSTMSINDLVEMTISLHLICFPIHTKMERLLK